MLTGAAGTLITAHAQSPLLLTVGITLGAVGLLSALRPTWLLDGSSLATAVSGFIAAYWSGRLVLQFTYLDRSDAPQGPWFTAAETALVSLFVFLSLTYTCAFATNLGR